jgi:hypothetical protein
MLNLPFIRALSALLDNTTMLMDAQVACHGIDAEQEMQAIAFDFQNTLLLISESI